MLVRADINKGLVGFGIIDSSLRDSNGETIGGIGSAIEVKPHSWSRKGESDVYTGTL